VPSTRRMSRSSCRYVESGGLVSMSSDRANHPARSRPVALSQRPGTAPGSAGPPLRDASGIEHVRRGLPDASRARVETTQVVELAREYLIRSPDSITLRPTTIDSRSLRKSDTGCPVSDLRRNPARGLADRFATQAAQPLPRAETAKSGCARHRNRPRLVA
jgi:hypothetical protein